MRYVQFAQPFAQQFGKVVVVADVGQEFAVVFCHLIPVYTVHVQVVEAFLFLLINVVEHVGTFVGQVHLHFGAVGDGFQFIVLGVHLLHAASAQDEEVVALLIQCERCPTCVHLFQQFGIALAQVHLPEVVAAFEGRHVVKAFAVGRKDGITQV